MGDMHVHRGPIFIGLRLTHLPTKQITMTLSVFLNRGTLGVKLL